MNKSEIRILIIEKFVKGLNNIDDETYFTVCGYGKKHYEFILNKDKKSITFITNSNSPVGSGSIECLYGDGLYNYLLNILHGFFKIKKIDSECLNYLKTL